ncbi:MAG: SEL1-like repeat protein [Firmicutes bacterium]|nr:SEL1-like repeat protein [Bacillota bacterium]
MSNKILFRNDELNEAILHFNEDSCEDTFIGVIIALANAYQMGAVFPVAVEGDMFRTINDEDGEFLSMFTDIDQAQMGPDTDLAIMSLEDLAGNILTEEGLAGFIVNPFTDPVLVDRGAVRAMVDTALSSPIKEVSIDLETMDPVEMVDLAFEIERGEGPYVPDPVLASSIYRNIIDDDFEMMPDMDEHDELEEFKAAQAQAMNNLGVLYMTGYGVDYDEDEARELFETAAKKLNTSAIYNLGAMDEDKDDYESAAARFEQAAILGDAKALAAYGKLLLKGLGVPRDPEKAFMYLKKAAESEGGEAAYYYLGLIYEEGLLGEKDTELAGHYYELGSSEGDVMAMDGFQRVYGFPYEDEDEDDDDDSDDEKENPLDLEEMFIDMSKLPRGLKN